MKTQHKLALKVPKFHIISKHKFYLITALVLIEFLIAGSAQAIESKTEFISSYGKVNYPTSTSTPAPTTPPSFSNNLAPILGKWGGYNLYGDVYYGSTSSPQIAHADFSVTHNGNPSIRLGARNTYNLWREINQQWIRVNPGDHVIMRCWIKTDPSTNNYRGGIFGFDVYGDSNRILEVTPRNPQSSIWNIVNSVPTEGGSVIYVPYGSGWTQLTIDVTIPSTTYTHDDYGKSISPQKISGLIPWVGGNWFKSDGTTIETANIWFADVEFYINP